MKPILLYEDSRAAGNRYGPHEFFLACVVDELGTAMSEAIHSHLKENRPLKGVTNILKALPKLADEDRPLVVVADNDRIREHLGLQRDTDHESVQEAILEGASNEKDAPVDLRVFLIERNLETILEALRDCGFPSTALKEAIKKSLLERDRALIAAARGDRTYRDCVRQKVPSLEPLIRHLAAIVPK